MCTLCLVVLRGSRIRATKGEKEARADMRTRATTVEKEARADMRTRATKEEKGAKEDTRNRATQTGKAPTQLRVVGRQARAAKGDSPQCKA